MFWEEYFFPLNCSFSFLNIRWVLNPSRDNWKLKNSIIFLSLVSNLFHRCRKAQNFKVRRTHRMFQSNLITCLPYWSLTTKQIQFILIFLVPKRRFTHSKSCLYNDQTRRKYWANVSEFSKKCMHLKSVRDKHHSDIWIRVGILFPIVWYIFNSFYFLLKLKTNGHKIASLK